MGDVVFTNRDSTDLNLIRTRYFPGGNLFDDSSDFMAVGVKSELLLN